MSQDTLEELITLGGPQLAAGQNPILKPKDTTPSTAAALAPISTAKTVENNSNAQMLQDLMSGKPVVPPVPPANTASSMPLPTSPVFKSQLPPVVGNSSLVQVTDSGNANAAGASFRTTDQKSPSSAPVQVPVSPVQQAPAQPVAQALPDGGDFDDMVGFGNEWEDAGEDTIAGAAEEEHATPAQFVQTAPVQATPSPVAVAVPVVPPKFDPIGSAVASANPAPVPQAKQESLKGDRELGEVESLLAKIESQVNTVRFNLGISLLSDPKNRQPYDWTTGQGNLLHEAIASVRWNAVNLVSQGPNLLLYFAHVLSAHQVHVQAEENQWQARYTFLNDELNRVMLIKRENYAADTKARSEVLALSSEPRLMQLREQFLIAQAMATTLKGMGERFAQLENGLKRTIEYAKNEYERARTGRQPM